MEYDNFHEIANNLMTTMEDAGKQIRRLCKEVKRLRKVNKELKSECYKDEKLDRLSKENKELKEQLCAINIHSEFTITEEEETQIKDWQNKHNKEKHPTGYFGAAGGELTYSFTPTGFGMFGVVRCVCGEKLEFRKP